MKDIINDKGEDSTFAYRKMKESGISRNQKLTRTHSCLLFTYITWTVLASCIQSIAYTLLCSSKHVEERNRLEDLRRIKG